MIYRLLLLTLLISFSFTGNTTTLDSLRTEKIKGKKYIIHRVEPKETFYSIARRYQITIDDIKKHNPELSAGLRMYDEIRIPILKKKSKKESDSGEVADSTIHIVSQGETLFAISRLYNLSVDSLRKLNDLSSASLSIGDTLSIAASSTEKVNSSPTPANVSLVYHVVKPSETLFGISRLYQVEIEDLQQWNNLADYSLSIGQKLLIGESQKKDSLIVSTTMVAEDTTKQKPELPVLDTLYVKTDNSQFKTRSRTVEGRKQTVEEGFVMKIEDTDYTSKFLALHRTAPLGSTILVKNQMNDVVIEARVVGKLPESAMNVKLLMRLSSAAYKALGAIDRKTPVTVSYEEDE